MPLQAGWPSVGLSPGASGRGDFGDSLGSRRPHGLVACRARRDWIGFLEFTSFYLTHGRSRRNHLQPEEFHCDGRREVYIGSYVRPDHFHIRPRTYADLCAEHGGDGMCHVC